MSKPNHKLPFWEKISYGFGDLASVLYWQTFMLYLTFFYTDVFLLPAGIAATMFLVSRILDGINDPMMGMIADRTNTKWGKFRPYLLWFAIPFAIVGVLTFTVPDYGVTGKIIWAYATFIMIMVLYTIINIPYTSLLGVISPSSKERTSVSSVKFIFAFAAGIIISATLLPLTQALGEGDDSIMPSTINGNELVIKESKKGASNYTISAVDAEGNVTNSKFRVKVVSAMDNSPRLKASIPEYTFSQETSEINLNLKEFFQANLHQDFKYETKDLNESSISVEINNGLLTLKAPSDLAYGSYKFKIKAIEEEWGEVATMFYVNKISTDAQLPIVIDSVDDVSLQNGFANTTIELNAFFQDNDPLQYSISNSNTNVIKAVLEENTLLLKEVRPGMSEVTITADDGKGGRVSKSVKYTLLDDENNAPIAIPKANITLVEGYDEYKVNLSDLFYDIEEEDLTYSYKIVNEAKGWSRFFMIVGVFAVIFFFIAFKGTKERVTPAKGVSTPIKKDLKELFTNKPWLVLLFATITFILFVAVRGSVTVHYFKYFIGDQLVNLPFVGEDIYDFNVFASAYNTIGQISALLGVFLVGILANKFGKRRIFNIYFVIAIFSTAIVFFLKPEQLSAIFFFQITGSMTGGPLSVLLWAMYADIADYSEWKNGKRATGLIFSASTMSQKFGWAFGGFVALTLMSQLGFEADAIQTEESLNGLIALFTVIPAGIGIISIIILSFYPLSDTRVKVIEGELIARRGALENE